MFARIQFSDDYADVSWLNIEHATGVLRIEPHEPAKLLHFQQLAVAIVGSVFHAPGDDRTDPQERARVEKAVLEIVPWLTDEDLASEEDFDFTIRTAIAHHRLPQNARLAREARIARILDEAMPDAGRHHLFRPHWDALHRAGVLVPDPILDAELRTTAAFEILRAGSLGWLQDKGPTSAMDDVLTRHDSVLGNLVLDVGRTMALPYLSATPAERAAWLQLTDRLLTNGHIQWMLHTKRAFDERLAEDVCTAILGTHLLRVLAMPPDEKGDALAQLLFDFEARRALAVSNATNTQMAQMSIDAVLAGVSLGETYSAQIRAYLRWDQDVIDKAEWGLGGDTLTSRRIEERKTGTAGAQADQDMDPVHAWSVSRLLDWIEGPVTQRPVDRKSVQTTQRERRAKATRDPVQPRPARPVQPTRNEERETNLMVDDALQVTAAFFLGDINELLPLATRLKVPPALLSPCIKARGTLSRLATQQGVATDQQIHAALTAAEQAIQTLRSKIRGIQAEEGQRMRFTGALAAALQREPLVLGKRHGGVIECAMPLTSWHWVAGEFHGRWLHDKRKLVINGHVVPLRHDQALALYVTGSSQSDFAFDVSVHLWQRRRGHTGPASMDSGGLMLMDTDHWFDTYMSCAVLHVPPTH